jgi:hypothetical protein
MGKAAQVGMGDLGCCGLVALKALNQIWECENHPQSVDIHGMGWLP